MSCKSHCSSQCRIGFFRGERGFVYSLVGVLLFGIIYLMSQMAAGGRATLGDLRVAHVTLKAGCTEVSPEQVRQLYEVYGERRPYDGGVRSTEFAAWLIAQDGTRCESLGYGDD